MKANKVKNIPENSAREPKFLRNIFNFILAAGRYMSILLRENCPICDGSGRMSTFEMTYQGKKIVRVRCTACDGTGEILSVDHTRTELGGNWKSHKKWKTVHYILDDRPLCGLIKSRKYISESIVVEEPDPSSICSSCIRKYDILTSS